MSAKDADGKALPYFYDGKVIRIAWDDAFAADEKRRVDVPHLINIIYIPIFSLQCRFRCRTW